MNVLIACEESQRVCTEFRKRGHTAFSCDILECSGEHQEWHIKGDCIPLLDGNCVFKTMDNSTHVIDGKWDLIIAFPPCTYLTCTGNRWFNVERYGYKALERLKKRQEATKFFMTIVNADCEHIAIENPIGVMSTLYKKPSQIIQPYYFGEPARKATCLWLKGLPKLSPTKIVEPIIIKYKNGSGTDNPWHMNTAKLPREERSRQRSKTFPGIADAMATQWSK